MTEAKPSQDQAPAKNNIFIQTYPTELTGGGKLKYEKENLFNPAITFKSEGGDIIIGSRNLFEEGVILYNRSKTQPMIIGNYNHFKMNARIESNSVGNFNEFGINSFVDSTVIVQNNNLLGTSAKLTGLNGTLNNKLSIFNGTIDDNIHFNENNHRSKIFSILKMSLAVLQNKGKIDKQRVAKVNTEPKA